MRAKLIDGTEVDIEIQLSNIAEDELKTRLTDHLEFHFIELPKLKRYNKDKETENDMLIVWTEFLSIQDESELMAMRDHYQRLSDAEKRWMEKGLELGVLEVAKKMKQQGFAAEVIQSITGLDLEVIEKL